MDLRAAEKLARQLILEHIDPLSGERPGPVGFKWYRRTSALGSYEVRILQRGPDYTPTQWSRTIYLSRPMVEVCDENIVRETLLHEIAHARAGIAAGHGPRWAEQCNLLGIEPKVCGGVIGGDLPTPKTGVRAVCKVCGANHWRPRMPPPHKRLACGQCRDRADFNTRQLTWERSR